MSKTPNTSRDIFEPTKRYFGSVFTQGQPVFDWDQNSTTDEMRWFMLQLAATGYGTARFYDAETGTNLGYGVNPATVPGNDVLISAGAAITGGRLSLADNAFNYSDENENYIAVGTVTTISEIIPATKYRILDNEKLWTLGYDLVGCRLKFESGVLAGQYFEIVELFGDLIGISGDASSAVTTDSYRILPPAFTTPTAFVSEELYLVTWFEDISPEEDTNLQDPAYLRSPSHKKALRTVIHKDWSGVTSTDIMSGHIAQRIATISRDPGDSTIDAGDIANENRVARALEDLSPRVDTLESQTLDTRLVSVEATALKVAVVDEVEYTQGTNNGLYWALDDANANLIYSDASFISKYKAADTTEPNLFNITGTTIANTTGNSSFVVIDVAGSDDSFSVAQRSGTNQIDADELALVAVHAQSSAPFNTTRAFPLSDRPEQVGFDYVVKVNPTPEIIINPGWSYRLGTLFQSPDQMSIDPTLTASWVTGALPVSDTWAYIYMRTQTDRRDLLPILDEESPKWNGEHKTEKAFCIGLFFYDSGTIPHMVCKDNTIYVGYSLLVLEDVDGATSYPATTYSLLPVPGTLKCSIRVDQNNTSSAVASDFSATDSYSATDVISHPLVLNTTDEYDVFEFPMRQQIGRGILTAVDSNTETRVSLVSISFNPLYMPDNSFWRD